jgi:alkylation response protein AidB-like acyl-CoA dehydrogenase
VDFGIGDDAVALVAALGEFFERRDDGRAIAEASATNGAASRARWDALCGVGIPSLRVPEPDGIGISLLDATAVAEHFGAVLLPEPASTAIVLAPAVAAVLDGSRVACLAAKNPSSGLIRVAVDDVTDLVAVPLDGPDGGLALIDRSAVGPVAERSDIDPSRPTALCHLEDAIAVEALVLDIAPLLREWAVLTISELVGGMQATLSATIDYARDRKQFGRSIGSFQSIKHQLADMYVAVEQARAAVQFAAISMAATDVAAAARWVPMSAIGLFERAIHLHGAMGYSWEGGVHLHLRRAVATRTLLRESGVTETCDVGRAAS